MSTHTGVSPIPLPSLHVSEDPAVVSSEGRVVETPVQEVVPWGVMNIPVE